MSETVETCGKAYCEHYPEGLFVCAKCREESTLAHDKACAKIAEAMAEIERLKRCCNCEYANHKLEICMHPDNEPETFMDGVCDRWSHNI